MKRNDSGCRLMALISTRIVEIMRREAENESSAILYRTGNYWTAFERSAYQIKHIYPNCMTYPVAVASLSHPVIIASLPCEELGGALDCVFPDCQQVVISASQVDIGKYVVWHKEMEEPLTEMEWADD